MIKPLLFTEIEYKDFNSFTEEDQNGVYLLNNVPSVLKLDDINLDTENSKIYFEIISHRGLVWQKIYSTSAPLGYTRMGQWGKKKWTFEKWMSEGYSSTSKADIYDLLSDRGKIRANEKFLPKTHLERTKPFLHKGKISYKELDNTNYYTGYYSIIHNGNERDLDDNTYYYENTVLLKNIVPKVKEHMEEYRTITDSKNAYEAIVEIYNMRDVILQRLYTIIPYRMQYNRIFDRSQNKWSEWRAMQVAQDFGPASHFNPSIAGNTILSIIDDVSLHSLRTNYQIKGIMDDNMLVNRDLNQLMTRKNFMEQSSPNIGYNLAGYMDLLDQNGYEYYSAAKITKHIDVNATKQVQTGWQSVQRGQNWVKTGTKQVPYTVSVLDHVERYISGHTTEYRDEWIVREAFNIAYTDRSGNDHWDTNREVLNIIEEPYRSRVINDGRNWRWQKLIEIVSYPSYGTNNNARNGYVRVYHNDGSEPIDVNNLANRYSYPQFLVRGQRFTSYYKVRFLVRNPIQVPHYATRDHYRNETRYRTEDVYGWVPNMVQEPVYTTVPEFDDTWEPTAKSLFDKFISTSAKEIGDYINNDTRLMKTGPTLDGFYNVLPPYIKSQNIGVNQWHIDKGNGEGKFNQFTTDWMNETNNNSAIQKPRTPISSYMTRGSTNQPQMSSEETLHEWPFINGLAFFWDTHGIIWNTEYQYIRYQKSDNYYYTQYNLSSDYIDKINDKQGSGSYVY